MDRVYSFHVWDPSLILNTIWFPEYETQVVADTAEQEQEQHCLFGPNNEFVSSGVVLGPHGRCSVFPSHPQKKINKIKYIVDLG